MLQFKSKTWCFIVLCGVFLSLTTNRGTTAPAQVETWPGDPEADAVLLTSLDTDMRTDLSGVHWNSATRTLWVVKTGRFWALIEDGLGSFKIREGGEWTFSGDMESITQADLNQPVVYVLVENVGQIKAINTAIPGVTQVLRTWSLSADLPSYDGKRGPEGLTFVPDDWLVENEFVDSEGQPYTSTLGMGGLMFIAHQNGGNLYAFDLNPNDSNYVFVGKYATSRSESSGLEFDRSEGRLYISHNTGGNFLEVSDLTSTSVSGSERRLHTIVEYSAPATTNLEGFALTPFAAGDHWCFYTEDHEASEPGQERALQWYQHCTPLHLQSIFLPIIMK
jgi:hypothetical protein